MTRVKLIKILLLILFIFILFIFCYYNTLNWMYDRFVAKNSYYSHGFFVPFITCFLVWQKKKELIETPLQSSYWGIFIIIISMLVHLAGTILYIFSLSGVSIFLFIIGLVLFLFGKDIFRIIIFPLIFLIFMFPLPQSVIDIISFPMKMLVATVSVDIVRTFGIPILREGFHITIPAGTLLVGDPCSGLRSLISFLALGSILGYLIKTTYVLKWTLFLLSIPIALISNIIRVLILIFISHFYGLNAASPDTMWHNLTGVLVFVIGFLMLILSGRLLENKE